jgi:hypothetical protein
VARFPRPIRQWHSSGASPGAQADYLLFVRHTVRRFVPSAISKVSTPHNIRPALLFRPCLLFPQPAYCPRPRCGSFLHTRFLKRTCLRLGLNAGTSFYTAAKRFCLLPSVTHQPTNPWFRARTSRFLQLSPRVRWVQIPSSVVAAAYRRAQVGHPFEPFGRGSLTRRCSGLTTFAAELQSLGRSNTVGLP